MYEHHALETKVHRNRRDYSAKGNFYDLEYSLAMTFMYLFHVSAAEPG